MTTAPPQRRVVTDALIDLVTAETLRPCWDADGPDPTDNAYDLLPYSFCELVGGSASYGDVSSPDGMVDVSWQFTTVGATRQSADVLMDKIRDVILTRDDTGDGFLHTISCLPTVVVDRRYESDGPPQVEGGIINVVERYRLTLHTAP